MPIDVIIDNKYIRIFIICDEKKLISILKNTLNHFQEENVPVLKFLDFISGKEKYHISNIGDKIPPYSIRRKALENVSYADYGYGKFMLFIERG